MEYKTLPRPLFHILFMMSAALAALYFADEQKLVDFSWLRPKQQPTVLIFFLLVVMYLSQWIVYFLSVNVRVFRVQTLRMLLWTEAVQMSVETDDASSSSLREKSRNVITTQAIFIATAVFVISALLEADILEPDSARPQWQTIAGYLALFLTTIAVMLLTVSADAAETTFNGFRHDEEYVVGYFYKLSARRKYYGYVLTGMAILVFVSQISPAIAALGMGLFILMGYAHWFPYLRQPNRVWLEITVLGVYMAAVLSAAYYWYFMT